MGTDVADDVDEVLYHYSFKVHCSMCKELLKPVNKLVKVFPEIEAAHPRCSTGIQALCLLNGALERAKQILRYCCESSKLYLVITGDVIISRCQRLRNNLEQSLGQIHSMVPTMLAAEISQIINDLNAATFVLDSSDEEAGKAVRELIQQRTSTSDSVEYSEMKALKFATSKLQIVSPKAILIEKRSIKRLLDKVGDNDPTKKKILKYLLYLLKKYGYSIFEDQPQNPKAQHEESVASNDSSNSSANNLSIEVESDKGLELDEAQADILSRGVPPEEFKCPISMRLMYDPVVIASGQTFERMWIQKWFDEGNDTCPKTKAKLSNLLLIPNIGMRDLISKWCKKYEVTIPDPSRQTFPSLAISSTSITSLGISMSDLHLPMDISSISLGSLDASYTSDSSRVKVADGSRLMSPQKTDDCHRLHESDSGFLARLSEHCWDTQCKMVEDVKSLFQSNDEACNSMSFENFVDPIIRYLREARDQHDAKALLSGSQLLLAFVSRNRSRICCLHEDAFTLLVSLLDSEVIKDSLSILETLSSQPNCRLKITASGALIPILKILDSHTKEHQEQAIKILHNLSSNNGTCTQIVYLECIPKLVPLINDGGIARNCILLLKNLCSIEEARVAVAETNGCIASIAELLESGSLEEQEHAVAILLSLCSQHVQYCQLVMDEGVIPSLVDISINGTDKGRASAQELLRQFRDIEYNSYEQQSLGTDLDAGKDAKDHKSSVKMPYRFFKMNF